MKKSTLIISTVLLVFTLHITLYTLHSFADIPRLINYQGRLTDSQGSPITGTKAVAFRIYDVESGGSALWSETYSNLSFDRGIFNVMLGGVTALNLAFDKPYWLSIQVGGDPEMTPRIRLASVGYAFRAENADNAAQAQNAAKVNSIEVSTTPQANKLLPLDANAKLPLSALGLKVYDSGWFEIVVNTTYTKPHNLGTTKVITLVYVSNHSDGSGICTLAQVQAYCYSAHFTVVALSTTEIKLRTGGGAPYIIDENGIPLYVNNPGTYARIIMLALE